MKRQMILTMMFLLPLLLGACNRAQVERNPEGGVTVTVTLSEADVNLAIEQALAAGTDPLLRNPSVELANGVIIASGEHDRRDGGGRVSGSLTIRVSVVNGTLAAEITEADIEGFDLSDERIAAFNERLADGLARRSDQENRLLTFESVTISDGQMEIVFTARRQNAE
jgi:hypothetical protein